MCLKTLLKPVGTLQTDAFLEVERGMVDSTTDAEPGMMMPPAT